MIHIFIINSHAGKDKFSAELRRHLTENYADLDYYIFHTRKVWDERNLIKEVLNLFSNERLRIYCCGGSGTISNAIYGIEDFSNLEFAFFPMGFTNDFLKVFGKNEDRFKNIDELIEGKVVNIDYIKTNHGNCLNTFSLGMDSEQVMRMEQFRDSSVLGKNVPYAFGFAYAVLFSKTEELEIVIDGKERIVGSCPELFFGNGGVIGGRLWFDAAPDITDGLGRLVVYKRIGRFRLIGALIRLARKDTGDDDIKKYDGYASEVSIRRRDGLAVRLDFDGELQEAQKEWTAKIIKRSLPFVVPKGVDIE